MRQQPSRAPRILRSDEVDLPEHTQRPERDVFEIADGRGDEEERTGHLGRAPRGTPAGVPVCLQQVVIVPLAGCALPEC